MPALPSQPDPSESCGVDGGDAGFDGDAFDLNGFGEDGVLKAIRQNFQYVSHLGATRWVPKNMHGLGFNLIHAHTNGHPLGLFGGRRFFDGFLHR
jgi:hypothetical protein